jgi:hypothetical protein
VCKEPWYEGGYIMLLDMDLLDSNDIARYIRYLYIAEELWGWLADNPESEKWHWPKFESSGIDDMSGNCPLCEFHKWTRHGCNKCILYKPRSEKGIECCKDYQIWAFNKNPDIRHKAALRIYFDILHERLRVMEWEDSRGKYESD